jgi:hypothetical protein
MPPVGGFGSLWNAQFQFSLFGQQVQNGIYFAATATPSASLETLGDALIEWHTTNILPLLGSNLTLRQVDLRDVSQPDGPVVVRNTGLPVDGGQATESLPSNVAFVLTFRTAQGGRKGRGRNYIPAIPENKSSGAAIDAALASSLQAGYQLLIGEGAMATGWTWSIASRVGAGSDGLPTNYYPITAVQVRDNIFDSQRRRLPGRGR